MGRSSSAQVNAGTTVAAANNVPVGSAKRDADCDAAVDSGETNAAQICNRTKSTVETGSDTDETDANPRAASGRESLSRSAARELQRQKIPHDRKRKRSRADSVPCLDAKKH